MLLSNAVTDAIAILSGQPAAHYTHYGYWLARQAELTACIIASRGEKKAVAVPPTSGIPHLESIRPLARLSDDALAALAGRIDMVHVVTPWGVKGPERRVETLRNIMEALAGVGVGDEKRVVRQVRELVAGKDKD
jgi:hypothetical protein